MPSPSPSADDRTRRHGCPRRAQSHYLTREPAPWLTDRDGRHVVIANTSLLRRACTKHGALPSSPAMAVASSRAQGSRWQRVSRSLTPAEWRRAAMLAFAIVALHVIGFGLLLG